MTENLKEKNGAKKCWKQKNKDKKIQDALTVVTRNKSFGYMDTDIAHTVRSTLLRVAMVAVAISRKVRL